MPNCSSSRQRFHKSAPFRLPARRLPGDMDGEPSVKLAVGCPQPNTGAKDVIYRLLTRVAHIWAALQFGWEGERKIQCPLSRFRLLHHGGELRRGRRRGRWEPHGRIAISGGSARSEVDEEPEIPGRAWTSGAMPASDVPSPKYELGGIIDRTRHATENPSRWTGNGRLRNFFLQGWL